MATTNIQLIGSGGLAGGGVTTKTWKNPPVGHVIGYSVAPKALGADDILLGPASFQITGVTTTMDTPNHFVVTTTVKNTGTYPGDFELFMSYLS